jgi:dihydroorotate dehydrogenase
MCSGNWRAACISLPVRFPEEKMHLTYDMHSTWEVNCERGPSFADEPVEVPVTPMKSFLGLPVRSRIGIAAGLLPNRRWVLPYALRGFDILTYKTVRSVARPCYPIPNWVFVEDTEPPDGPVYVVETAGDDPALVSSSVCFGMPSSAPDVWREDIRHTRAKLGEGQLLVVSVVATPSPASSLAEISADFTRCAAWAVEAGADIVEANLSCPNVCTAEGSLYRDIASSKTVVSRIREAIGSTPLLLKLGVFPDDSRMQQFLHAMNGLANGVTLVNCISRPVLHRDGRPAFGPEFTSAGVLGRAIHNPSVAAVRAVKQYIAAEGLKLEVAAVGGVSTPKDMEDFFAAGANAVLCGSSPMYVPNLAIDCKRLHPEW